MTIDRDFWRGALATALGVCMVAVVAGVVVYAIGLMAALLGGMIGALLVGLMRLVRALFGG